MKEMITVRNTICNNPVFSVIVPVFNTGTFLRKCVESIRVQSYRDFEILLIDDGSTDDSGTICDELSQLDKRIRVFHKSNGGVSSARNVGLDNVKGRYVVFVDSDDFIDCSMLQLFSEKFSDLVIMGFGDYWLESNKTVIYESGLQDYCLTDDRDIISYLKTGCAAGFVWAKCFSKDIIEQYGIRFNEDQPHSEDILFINEYLLNIKFVRHINHVGYFHNRSFLNSLSTVAMKQPLIERTGWWQKALEQFEGHNEIQKYYADMFLFLFEIEVKDIAGSDDSFMEKWKKTRDLISVDSFHSLLQISGKTLPESVRFCCHFRLALLVLLKYRLNNIKPV